MRQKNKFKKDRKYIKQNYKLNKLKIKKKIKKNNGIKNWNKQKML